MQENKIYSKKLIQVLKEHAPLYNIHKEFGFPPRRFQYKYRSRCLLHGGDNPTSFSADLERGIWQCFSCGRGGDQITFLMEILKCPFSEAIQALAFRAGINHAQLRDLQYLEASSQEKIKRYKMLIADYKSLFQIQYTKKQSKRRELFDGWIYDQVDNLEEKIKEERRCVLKEIERIQK